MPSNGTSFNLMRRPWIPATMLDGTRRMLSIRETIDLSPTIRSIDGDMPLQRFALVRLLISVLYGTFGHDFTVDQWRNLFDRGSADPTVQQEIHGYCEDWEDRFDLFDDEAPFYQVAGLHTAKHEVFGLERLILDVPSGEPFFTTRSGDGLTSIDAAEAARWLVTVQAYDASGIKSGAVGDPRVKGGKGYPIGVAWTGHLGGLLVEGATLWQTLMLNFVGKDVLDASESDVNWDEDAPAWERPVYTACAAEGFDQAAERVAETSFFHGPATLLTWQSRRILLAHHGETVTGVLVCNGDRLKPQNAQAYEMMSGWSRNPKQEETLKHPLIYMPREHDPNSALWRGLPTLTVETQTSDSSEAPAALRPYSLRWLSTVCANRPIPVRLRAFGVKYGNKKAVIDATVDDVLDLNLVVLTSRNPKMGKMLQEAVNDVDQGVIALRDLAADLALAAGLPTDQPKQQAKELGYAAFDSVFRQWVRGIDGDGSLAALRSQWNRIAKRLLVRLGMRLTEQAPVRAIVGRVVDPTRCNPQHYSAALAEIWYRGKLNSIFPDQKGQ